jgi:hypothetical protein
MLHTGWLEALVDIDRSTEFTGDDVDQYSKLVDLGIDCDELTIDIPTITSSTVGVMVQKDKEVDTVPIPVYYRQPTDLATAVWATTAATTACSINMKLGGYQYIRIKCGSNQAADRSFKVKGTSY